MFHRKPPPIAVLAVAVYVGHCPSPFRQWLRPLSATIKTAMGSGLHIQPLPKRQWAVVFGETQFLNSKTGVQDPHLKPFKFVMRCGENRDEVVDFYTKSIQKLHKGQL